MYRRILVPTDGSEGTERAVQHAIDLASTYDAALHALYVVDTNLGPDYGMVGLFDTLKEVGQNAVNDVVERAEAAGIEATTGFVGEGPPYRMIRDYADENDIDLIVMGTHGRTGLDRYLLGSVTEKVVRMANVPVLTIPMAAHPSQSQE